MPALSLTALAQRAAARNQSQVTYDAADPALWRIPYHKLEPVLKRIEDPDQLHEIEENTEHIAANTGPLWQAFIKRDVTNGASKMFSPKDPKNWHKVYRKMMRQEQREKLEAEENLRKAMMGIDESKSEKKTVFVDKNLLSKGKPKEFVDGVRKPRGSEYRSLNSYKPKEDAIGQIRKATAVAARNKFAKPMYSKVGMPSASEQIEFAPKSMILQHQKPVSLAAQQAAATTPKLRHEIVAKSQISKVFAPSTGLNKVDKAVQQARWEEQKKREARLKAFTTPNSGTTTSPPRAIPATATTARPLPAATGSFRPTATPQSRNTAAPKTTASTPGPATKPAPTSLPPSPPRTASPQKPASPAPALLKRKRPAADPFMPTKKGRH